MGAKSEVITLVPALLAFFIGAPRIGSKGLPYNSALLFTGKLQFPLLLSTILTLVDWNSGMALSRIGLWSFDLCQLKELQQALDDHPRKNTMSVLSLPLLSSTLSLSLPSTVVLILSSDARTIVWLFNSLYKTC